MSYDLWGVHLLYELALSKSKITVVKNLISVTMALFVCTMAKAQNVPVTFEPAEFGANWNWKVFENGSNPPLLMVANPDTTGLNPSATVARFDAQQFGAPFAGCETMHGTDIGTFTIDANNKIIRIMVYKTTVSDVGIKLVRFDNWSLGEIKIPNTKTNEWEQLEFDFSAHMGNTYDQMVIFPDFTGRPEDRIIYFDNIWGDKAELPPPPPPAPDSAKMSLPNVFTPNLDGANDYFAPNVQHADWLHWQVFTRWGQLVFETKDFTEKWDGNYKGNELADGVYFVLARCGSDEVGNVVSLQKTVHLIR